LRRASCAGHVEPVVNQGGRLCHSAPGQRRPVGRSPWRRAVFTSSSGDVVGYGFRYLLVAKHIRSRLTARHAVPRRVARMLAVCAPPLVQRGGTRNAVCVVKTRGPGCTPVRFTWTTTAHLARAVWIHRGSRRPGSVRSLQQVGSSVEFAARVPEARPKAATYSPASADRGYLVGFCMLPGKWTKNGHTQVFRVPRERSTAGIGFCGRIRLGKGGSHHLIGHVGVHSASAAPSSRLRSRSRLATESPIDGWFGSTRGFRGPTSSLPTP